MKLGREQETGSGMEGRVVWLEKFAKRQETINDATSDVLKALENMIASRGDVLDAKSDVHTAEHGSNKKLITSLGELVKAQGNMLNSLANQARVHKEVLDGLIDRVKTLEG